MSIKRALALILSAAMFAAALAACGEEAPVQSPASTTAAEAADAATEAETTEFLYKSGAPDADFGGEKFRVATTDPSLYAILLDFDFEQEDGDVIDDAIYRRNRKIEEKYNIVFTNEITGEWNAGTELLKKTALSGDDAYDMIMVINRDSFAAAISGYIMPIASIPYLDIEAPWYCRELNKQFTIGGKMFLAYTDECMNMYAQTTAVMYNKNILGNIGGADPYAQVREGKWTYDVFAANAMSAISDVNGDGTFSAFDDIMGVGSEPDMLYPGLWVSADLKTVVKDDSDIPQYTAAGDERLIGLLETMASWSKTDGFVANSFKDLKGYSGEPARDQSCVLFAGGHFLYRVGPVTNVLLLRNMEADFGLLPTPKYDEAQSTYYSRMCDGWIHVAPITVTRLELLGTIMEALGAETKNYVMPAFFDVAMTHKLTRDEDSAEMMNIIFDNVTVDLGDTVWQGDIRSTFTDKIANGKEGYASVLEKLTKRVTKTIDKAVAAAEELE